MVRVLSADGQAIQNLSDWRRLGGPQRPHQWKDGRSAKECAKAWLRRGTPAVPAELKALLGSHPGTTGLSLHTATTEIETKLDDYRGKGRVHDLLAEGKVREQRVTVSVEAKADESFGELVGEARSRALARSPRSMVPARIDGLRAALFGPGVNIEDLRYQLVYGVAGALIEAARRNATVAIFAVHEFVIPGHFSPIRVRRNADDFDAIVRALGASAPTPGVLAAVPAVPGGGRVPAGVQLLLGKARYP